MRLSEGVEWAVHCVTVLALLPTGDTISAAHLAEFHGVPPAYLAKTLQALARAGIVASVPGRNGGYRLDRAPAAISVLEVVEAVDGDEPSFNCTEIRRRGPARVKASLYPPVCGIAAAMYRADEAWRAELRRTSIADVLVGLADSVPPEAARKAAAWFQEVL